MGKKKRRDGDFAAKGWRCYICGGLHGFFARSLVYFWYRQSAQTLFLLNMYFSLRMLSIIGKTLIGRAF